LLPHASAGKIRAIAHLGYFFTHIINLFINLTYLALVWRNLHGD
jgi:hypothetical protein